MQKIAIQACQRFGFSMPYRLWFRYVLDIHISARKIRSARLSRQGPFIWATVGTGLARLARYEQAWRSLVPNSEHRPLAFNHGTMFREGEAKLVADQMKIYLAEAQAAQARLADAPSRALNASQSEARVVARDGRTIFRREMARALGAEWSLFDKTRVRRG